MQAAIRAIEYYLPEKVLSNDDLALQFPEWGVEKIANKTGISVRHIAEDTEFASDLGYKAALRLFDTGICQAKDVDYLLFCTQSPDYFLPTTACILQSRLGIPMTSGALDFNLGCSGFVYGLGMAKGLIETGQAQHVLLITAETYSKFIHPADKSNRTLFGDAAAATLISGVDNTSNLPAIGPFLYGTDGRGADNLIVKTGGMRYPKDSVSSDLHGSSHPNSSNLYMNGPEIFAFTLSTVPQAVEGLLRKSAIELEDVDLFVFHQANSHMLTHLRKKIGIPEHKFLLALDGCGNTVSSTIPIALRAAQSQGLLVDGARMMVVGFGVGYSWAAALLQWKGNP